MRFILSIILIAFIASFVEYFLPWWSIAIVAFIVSFAMAQKPAVSFLAGFLGIALFWLCAVLFIDWSNNHILSGKLAFVFKLPNYGMFIFITILVGGIIGGFAAWAAALLRSPEKV